MKRATLAATLLCCVAGPALAQSTPQAMSPQDQRKLESLSKDQAATKAQATTTINVLAQNQSECLKAIGNAYFCNCIAQAIPVGLDFIGYVTVRKALPDLSAVVQVQGRSTRFQQRTRRWSTPRAKRATNA
jgi:hypothetical protein